MYKPQSDTGLRCEDVDLLAVGGTSLSSCGKDSVGTGCVDDCQPLNGVPAAGHERDVPIIGAALFMAASQQCEVPQ
jgi:hypothetical protein